MNFKHMSIIIPTLNEAKGITPFLTALQHFRKDCELIVVDGGSRDDTSALAAQLADTVTVAPAGRAMQMNHGANVATGTILVFLHADTYLPENALTLVKEHLNDHHCWGRFDVKLTGDHFMLPIIAFMMNWRSRLTGIATGDQAIFVTRSAFTTLGGFPEIALMEDIALSKSLKKISKPACLQAKVSTSGRRWENNGVFKTIFLMWWLRARFACGVAPDRLAARYAKSKSR